MCSNLSRLSARCAMLVLALGACVVPASAADVDAVLGAAPTYSAPAPVPVYAPAVDMTNGQTSGPGIDPADGTPQQVEADIDTLGYASGVDFVALILDRDATDNLYIKVQAQSPLDGKFNCIGFYHGAAAGGWSGMTGGVAFFTLPSADQFETAHMTVIHDGAGNVTLRLTNIDGGGKTLEFTRGGWVPRNAKSGGFGGYAGNFAIDNWGMGEPVDYTCDNFNRANGGLGAGWVTIDGNGSIVGNTARGTGSSRSIFIGTCGGGIGQQVEADIRVLSTTLDYCALVLNWDGVDNLYVKLQRQATSAGTAFTHVGLYDSVNGLAWPGQTGGPSFFTLPTEQQFTTAHMRVTVDGGGTVRLILTEINGGTGMLEFQRGGWPFRNGNGAGFGGFDNFNRIDNWSTGGVGICDTFNRASGALGSHWLTTNGTATILSKEARGDNTSRSIFVGTCGECYDTTPPVVEITAPTTFACGCLNITITGTASDPDGEYIGDVLEYRASDTNTWTQAGSSSVPRTGTLYTWNTAGLAEGYYFVRVTGRNECGRSSSDDTVVRVNKYFDSIDLRSPAAGAILGGTICIDGTAYENNCFDYYTLMYRPAGGGTYAPVDTAHPTYTAWVLNDPLGSWNTASGPTAVPDGDYQLRLQGLDTCGYSKDVVHTIRVDNTPPIAVLSSALTCDSVAGAVEIRGTATDANLAGWTLTYTGGDQHGWSPPIAAGNTPIINGVLGTWNTAGLRKCAYTLRLTVTDNSYVNCTGLTHQTDYYVGVGVGWYTIGDMNCDGIVNFDDINPFVACLSSGGNCGCP